MRLLTQWSAFPAWRSCTSRWLPIYTRVCICIFGHLLLHRWHDCSKARLTTDTIYMFTLLFQVARVSVDNVCFHKCQKVIGTQAIHLRKIVLANYQGSKTHIDFVKFFVWNARVLESMRLELEVENFSKAWIARQRSLLDIKKRASRGARITFVSRKFLNGSLDLLHVEQVHDLSIDLFERFHQ